MKTIIAALLIFSCSFAKAQDSDFNSMERQARRAALITKQAQEMADFDSGQRLACAADEDAWYIDTVLKNKSGAVIDVAKFRQDFADTHWACVNIYGFKP